MMGKGIFVTGTGTDIGKTYVTTLLVKKLKESGCLAGYYKAVISGADTIKESDAGYVKRVSGIQQEEESLVTYLYKQAVSPHLAALLEGESPDMQAIFADYQNVCQRYDYVTIEGSGGIVCPIRWDHKKILLENIIQSLGLSTLLIAEAGLGTINATVLTVEYLKNRHIGIKGIILNRYTGNRMEEDNVKMIEELTDVPVIACVQTGATEIDIEAEYLKSLYEY